MGARERSSSWWDRNKDKVNAKRRARLASDREFAAREVVRRKEHDARQREMRRAKEVEMTDTFHLPKRQTRRPQRPKKHKIVVEGVELEAVMYTSGALAQALDRTSQAIRIWERAGTLPEALYRDDRDRRLYTEAQVVAIIETVRAFREESKAKKFGGKRMSTSDVGMKIASRWDELPGGVTRDELDKARKRKK